MGPVALVAAMLALLPGCGALRVPPAARARFAVVRPFWKGELNRLGAEELPACRSSSLAGHNSSLPVDLVLYYAGSPRDETSHGAHSFVSDKLQALSQDPAMRRCFSDVRVEYARVPPGIQYPAAPCVQFTKIFATQPKPAWGYESFFQMELDVRPLREGWLEDMLPLFERAARGDAWVIGGFYDSHCLLDEQGHNPIFPSGLAANDPRVDHHPNGNAVYSTTMAYLKQVENQEGKCRYGGLSSHYDFNMFETWKEHRHSQPMADKWVTDPFFKNCKPTPAERAKGVSTMPPHDIAVRFPETLLAHCRIE